MHLKQNPTKNVSFLVGFCRLKYNSMLVHKEEFNILLVHKEEFNILNYSF